MTELEAERHEDEEKYEFRREIELEQCTTMNEMME